MNYSPQLWDKDGLKFLDVPFDINENKHFSKSGQLQSDYEIFIKANILPDDIQLVKINAKAAPVKAQALVEVDEKQAQSLEIMGFSSEGEVLFKFINEEQGIN